MKKIGVVIPSYNAEMFIGQAVESIINQSYNNWKLVVIDDGSRDRSLDIVQRYSERDTRVQVLRQQNAGVANARNRGIDLLSDSVDYVLLLDHDDYLESDALEVLCAALDANPSAVAVYGFYREVDSAGAVICDDPSLLFGYVRRKLAGRRRVAMHTDEPTSFETLANGNCIITPGQVLIRCKILLQAGRFDQTVVPSDDWDMYLRLSTLGNLPRINRIVVNKRTHPENVSHRSDFVYSQLAVRKKLVRSPLLKVQQRQLIQHGYVYLGLKQLYWARYELARFHYKVAFRMIQDTARIYARYLHDGLLVD